ncbi:type II toxin-antitoxin system HicA family toxin [Chryseobacterium arthrosphaerae]|uniref:Type II toxin-antitoxin system HicA family toxin n=1 Tax=Chryseobacterium arthrosphaerae TaxID=651561 RepID=A0ABU7R2Z3_9FLAO
MKVSEMLKILKKDGWYLHRNGAKHDLYVHDTKDGSVTVPRHPSTELKKGTEQSILKAAGLK